jgi:hypothetical protein
VASGHAVMEVANRFEEAYQASFAWVCRAAEAAEREWAIERLGTAACEKPSVGYFGACETSLMPASLALAAH